MVISKNINNCKLCVMRRRVTTNHLRRYHPESSHEVTQKLQARNIVLSQWKLITSLQSYVTKLPQTQNIQISLKKEFDQFLQRIQPLYKNDAWKQVVGSLSILENKEDSSKKSGPYVQIHLSKANNLENTKWQGVVPVSKESIVSRSRQILASLIEAKSTHTVLKRIEELNEHVNKYPEGKHIAVKEGAIQWLLKIRQKTNNNELSGTLNETLALLGYVKPVSGSGIRILSIDGGGIRGMAAINMLKKLEELSGKPIHEMFDLICGVSTGAIIASLISTKQYSLEEILKIYRDLSIHIFTQSTLKGTSNLVWSHSYYDTALWEKLLKNQIGDQTLISTARVTGCPKLCILSTVVNQARLSAYVFRNYNLPCNVQSQYLGGHRHLIWEAVRASAAAPTYFEEFKLGNKLHQDGGILYNNPTSVAIHEAKLLWPQTPIQCVISFGTGRTIPVPEDSNAKKSSANSSSWKDKFYAIIESATDTEGVHSILSDLLPGNVYFRFNPYLTEMLDIAEIDNKKLEQLERDVVMYLRRNEDKFHEATNVLRYEKSTYQKSVEWMKLQQEMIGLKA